MVNDLVVDALRKRFETEGGRYVDALQDVSLKVERGTFFVLVGDSGSGKTTLLRSIAGLETPDSGRIELRGALVFSGEKQICVTPQERGVGMVFQSYAIWPHLTVYQNVALPLTRGRFRLPRNEVEARVRNALAVVGLSGFEQRPAPNLSGGQQQRVALARALAVSSSMLLMDEPLSNLDARLREEVRSQIRAIAKQYETTVLYVTHDQVEALAVADRMALMRGGSILQEGTPEDLYDQSRSREVAEFFGPLNLLEGEVIGNGFVKTDVGLLRLEVDCAETGKVWVGFRPERARLHLSCQDTTNRLEARIVSRVFLGGRNVYEVACHNKIFRVEALTSYRIHQVIHLELRPDVLRLFKT
jgi:iron(III) transport system ATP-binding protein